SSIVTATVGALDQSLAAVIPVAARRPYTGTGVTDVELVPGPLDANEQAHTSTSTGLSEAVTPSNATLIFFRSMPDPVPALTPRMCFADAADSDTTPPVETAYPDLAIKDSRNEKPPAGRGGTTRKAGLGGAQHVAPQAVHVPGDGESTVRHVIGLAEMPEYERPVGQARRVDQNPLGFESGRRPLHVSEIPPHFVRGATQLAERDHGQLLTARGVPGPRGLVVVPRRRPVRRVGLIEVRRPRPDRPQEKGAFEQSGRGVAEIDLDLLPQKLHVGVGEPGVLQCHETLPLSIAC